MGSGDGGVDVTDISISNLCELLSMVTWAVLLLAMNCPLMNGWVYDWRLSIAAALLRSTVDSCVYGTHCPFYIE